MQPGDDDPDLAWFHARPGFKTSVRMEEDGSVVMTSRPLKKRKRSHSDSPVAAENSSDAATIHPYVVMQEQLATAPDDVKQSDTDCANAATSPNVVKAEQSDMDCSNTKIETIDVDDEPDVVGCKTEIDLDDEPELVESLAWVEDVVGNLWMQDEITISDEEELVHTWPAYCGVPPEPPATAPPGPPTTIKPEVPAYAPLQAASSSNSIRPSCSPAFKAPQSSPASPQLPWKSMPFVPPWRVGKWKKAKSCHTLAQHEPVWGGVGRATPNMHAFGLFSALWVSFAPRLFSVVDNKGCCKNNFFRLCFKGCKYL